MGGASTGMQMGTSQTVLLKASLIRRKYIWFRGGDLNGFWDIITNFKNWLGQGMPPGQALESRNSKFKLYGKAIYMYQYSSYKKSEQCLEWFMRNSE